MTDSTTHLVMNLWPPPTNSMTADELAKLLTITEQFILHAKETLPRKCAAEGHVWDSDTGKLETVYSEDWVWGANGDPAIKVTTPSEVFSRKCQRCGVKDSRDPVPTSPFATTAYHPNS